MGGQEWEPTGHPGLDRLAAVVAATADWFGRATPRRKVVAPDLVGMRASQRALPLVRVGLRSECIALADRPVGDGVIVRQHPAAGAKVRRGSTVQVWVMHPERQ